MALSIHIRCRRYKSAQTHRLNIAPGRTRPLPFLNERSPRSLAPQTLYSTAAAFNLYNSHTSSGPEATSSTSAGTDTFSRVYTKRDKQVPRTCAYCLSLQSPAQRTLRRSARSFRKFVTGGQTDTCFDFHPFASRNCSETKTRSGFTLQMDPKSC